ncbi:MAG: hypothetical protein LUH14_04065 [Clostridiaceae bacterium]|nr:hypothetical protein [Clostridiaceae bacterium]
MAKATYRVRETKDRILATYTGDLANAAEKARQDLRREVNNPDIEHWQWLAGQAQKRLLAHDRKIDRINTFLRIAEQELERQNQGDGQEVAQ